MRVVGCLVAVFALLGVCLSQSCLPTSSPNVTSVLDSIMFCRPYATSAQVFMPSVALPFAPPLNAALRIYGTLDLGTHTGPSKACLDALAALICRGILPPCSTTTNSSGGSVATFSQSCTSDCSALAAQPGCLPGFLGLLGSPNFNFSGPVLSLFLPTCNSSWPPSQPYIGGQPRFGPLTWQVDAATVLNVPCTAAPPVAQNSSTWPCYGPFQTATNQYTSPPDCGYCEFKCPIQFVPDGYLDKQAIVFQVLAWTAGVLMLILIPLRLSVKKFSTYPASLVQLSCLMLLLTMIPTRLDSFYGWRNIVCPNGIPANGTNAPLCSVTGWFSQWGIVSWIFSWMVIAIHCFAAIYFPGAFSKITMWISYISIVASGIISVLILAIAKQWGMNPFLPICLTNDIWYGIGTEFIPLDIMWLVGTACIIAVIVRITSVSADSKLAWKANLRMLVFLFGVLVFVVAFSANIYYSVYWKDAWGAAFGNYLGCSFTQDGCDRGFSFNTSWGWFLGVWVSSCGWIQVITFGTNKELYTGWSDRQNPWEGFKQGFAVQTESSSTATTGGSSSSSGTGSDSGTFMSDLQ